LARLPTKVDLGGLPSAKTGRPIASYDVTAVGKGIQDLGRGISRSGEVLADHRKAAEKYETEARYQDFKWNQQEALDRAKFETTSDQVDGFNDRWVQGFKESAQQFYETIPDSLKDDYGLKLRLTERGHFRDSSNFMRTEQRNSAINRLGERKTSYIQRSQSGAPLDEIKNDYAGLVAANPYLSEIDKDKLLRNDLGEMEVAHIQSRWKSSGDPDAVMRDLGGVLLDTDENPELRAEPTTAPASNDNLASPARISIKLETGKDDPLEGVSQVARDSGGSKSYGNFGLNSGGSAQQFAAQYGEQFGLTAEPGTAEFDKQWKNAAGAAPVELHASEMQWYQDNVIAGITDKLASAGVPDDIAGDPRVQAYFADRVVQQGPGSIDGMNKHKRRISAALAEADGDPAEFLKAITEADRDALGSDFPTALKTGVYSERGHDTRLNGRLNMALGVTGEGASTQPDILSASYKGPYQNIPAEARLKLMETFQEEYRNRQRAAAVLGGTLPVDPASSEDRKTIDKAFEATPLLDGITNHDRQSADQLSHLAKTISYIPERAFETLRGMALNGTVEDRHYAYQTLGRIMRERPAALSVSGGEGFTRDMADEIETFNTMVTDVGLPAEEAIGRIDQMRSPEFQARQSSLKKEAAEVVKDLAVEDITREYRSWFTSPAAGGSDRQAVFMLDAYRDMVNYHYIRTGDPKLAKKVALNEMKKAYKVSNITGNKRLMAHAPETYYDPIETVPGDGPSYEYFQEELVRAVNERAGRLGAIEPGTGLRAETGLDDIPLEDIFLEVNDQTYADLAAGKPHPSYSVAWREYDENGIPAFMVAPGNFYVDVKTALTKQSAIITQRAREDRAENTRQIEREGERPLYQPIMPQFGQGLELPEDQDAQ
jgi:hypothetical protein